MPPDLSPTSHAAYLKEKPEHLHTRQADLDVAQIKLERRREEMEQHLAALRDDDNCAGAPSVMCFPSAAYNMAAAACRLGDISHTPNIDQ